MLIGRSKTLTELPGGNIQRKQYLDTLQSNDKQQRENPKKKKDIPIRRNGRRKEVNGIFEEFKGKISYQSRILYPVKLSFKM